MTVVAPGGTIGIVGGGQLGRMMTMAARSMGYDVHVLDADAGCPARGVATHFTHAALDDGEALVKLARACAVLTLEIERAGTDGLTAAAAHTPVRPSGAVLHVIQDRARQKDWLAVHGFPVGPYRTVATDDESRDAVIALGPCVLKTCTGGYDGRGQARLETPDDAAAAFRSLGGVRCVAERFLPLDRELSVMVARRPGGESVAFPAALNHHENGILAWSVLPAPIEAHASAEADRIGRAIAEALGVEGLLAIEFFLLADGTLLVNELAPRPHNSFHGTERACDTSQFEQAVRAVCDLPLGDAQVVRPTAIANVLGDLWDDGRPAFDDALRTQSLRLHLYGKKDPRAGRKMGHLSACGATAEEALTRVRGAWSALRPSRDT